MTFFLGLLATPAGRALAATLGGLLLIGAVLLGAVQYGKLQERHKNELAIERAKTASAERDIKAANDAAAAADKARQETATEAASEKGRLNVLRQQLATERAARGKLPSCAGPANIGRRLRDFRDGKAN